MWSSSSFHDGVSSFNSDTDGQGGGQKQEHLSECRTLGGHIGMMGTEGDFVWNTVLDVAEEAP